MVVGFLLCSQNVLFAGFDRRFAICVKREDALETAVGKKFDFIARTFEILFENSEVMRTSLVACNGYYSVVGGICEDQSFDCMTLFLSRIPFLLPLLGRSIGCSVTSIKTTSMSLSAFCIDLLLGNAKRPDFTNVSSTHITALPMADLLTP